MALDYKRFNIRGRTGLYLCPSCGFPGCFNEEPYNENGGLIGTGICPCCLFEPGFDDNPAASPDAGLTILESIAKYRATWVAAGMPWRGAPTPAPPEWNPGAQLRDLVALLPAIGGSSGDLN